MTTSQDKGEFPVGEIVKATEKVSHHHFIRRCFESLFDYADVQSFCKTYFIKLSLNLGIITNRDSLVDEIIIYCEKYSQFEYAWKCIGLVRPTNYQPFYDQWVNTY